MNYEEMGFREQYNEILFSERDIIQRFLEKQYDIRYGRQRDSWHFEPAVKMLSHYGNVEHVTDIMLDKDRFVIFILDDAREYECFDFAYGELSKIIEALPDVNQILIKDAVSDIARLCRECSVNLEEYPFNTNINGKSVSVALVDFIDGRVVAYNHDGKVVSDEYASDFLVGLRNHINIEVLHRTKEYKEVMQWLALEPNLRKSVDEYAKTNYGCVLFTLAGTDIEFDVSAIQRDDKGNLTIFGADTCREDELITLTEKDIKKEYLEVILKWLTTRGNIMDEYNGHNNELVRKINAAWKDDKYHNSFSEILLALLVRDHDEYIDKYGEIEDYSGDWAMEHAHEIMEGVCDDLDLECILKFIRY